MIRKKHWYNYLWVYSILYLILGVYNIFFAWLGVIEFAVPLIIALFGGDKLFCNHFCGKGQLFNLLGKDLKLSKNRKPPLFLSSTWFRYGFLMFFMTMFVLMLITTFKVFLGEKELKEIVTILWSFKIPWGFAYKNTNLSPWIAQFAFGMYSIMLTSSIIGFITMLVFRPRTWCVYCPMGTMTQGICKIKHRDKN